MPNVNDRLVPGAQPYVPPSVDPVSVAQDVPKVPKVESPVDGLETPRASDGPAAQAPRKALASRLSTMARRMAKGAAVLGLAIGLAVGGTVWMKMSEHQPVKPAVTVETPVEVSPNTLPQSHAPPGADAKGQTLPGDSLPAPMPSAPGQVKPTVQLDGTPTRPVFSPHSIRLDSVLPN